MCYTGTQTDVPVDRMTLVPRTGLINKSEEGSHKLFATALLFVFIKSRVGEGRSGRNQLALNEIQHQKHPCHQQQQGYGITVKTGRALYCTYILATMSWRRHRRWSCTRSEYTTTLSCLFGNVSLCHHLCSTTHLPSVYFSWSVVVLW